jgi:hypothetical protein
VRIWQRPHVKVGGRYPLGPGHIVVTSIREIALSHITGELARRSGFEGVVDLLKIAKHGRGENVYLVEFEYEAPRVMRKVQERKAPTKKPSASRK